VTARPTRSITIRAKDCSTFNFELTEQRVPGDCAFFPRLLEPSERLQRRTDTEDPKVHPRRETLEQVRMEACESVFSTVRARTRATANSWWFHIFSLFFERPRFLRLCAGRSRNPSRFPCGSLRSTLTEPAPVPSAPPIHKARALNKEKMLLTLKRLLMEGWEPRTMAL
jgi:hypothetical protein